MHYDQIYYYLNLILVFSISLINQTTSKIIIFLLMSPNFFSDQIQCIARSLLTKFRLVLIPHYHHLYFNPLHLFPINQLLSDFPLLFFSYYQYYSQFQSYYILYSYSKNTSIKSQSTFLFSASYSNITLNA